MFIDFLHFIPPCPNDWLGQMASIPIPVTDPENFKNKLLSNYNIQIPVFKWEDKTLLRYSIQTYNADEELEKLLGSLDKLSKNQTLDVFSCVECGRCTEVCPAHRGGGSLDPKNHFILDLKDHLLNNKQYCRRLLIPKKYMPRGFYKVTQLGNLAPQNV